ncbi:MAG: hypothetical protein ACTHN5_15030 [Phycisphaerae bacterium]
MTHDTPAQGLRPRASSLNKGLWIVGLGLLANAAVMLYGQFSGRGASDLLLDRAAFAQASPGAGQPLGARGIYMMPAQLGNNAWGVYLMDVDSQTISVYRALPETNRFRLMAVRSFKNDRFLENFNNEAPLPKDVEKMVAQERQRLNLASQTTQPTVDQSPKPDENAPDAPK